VQIDGALCELIAVPYEHIIICNEIDPLLTALIEPLSVGYHLANRTRVNSRDIVAVFGCGAIGLGAIAAAKHKDACVVALDIANDKLGIAKTIGADYTINSAEQDVSEMIEKITGGNGANVVMECAGVPSAFKAALDIVCFTGRMGIVSYSTREVTFNTKPIVSKELEIYGSRNALGEFDEVIGMIKGGMIPVKEMISRIVAFDDSKQIFEEWSRDPASFTKIIIQFS
jgi:threonine dehydrogenase-like Zn-dependent dehydrogenase